MLTTSRCYQYRGETEQYFSELLLAGNTDTHTHTHTHTCMFTYIQRSTRSHINLSKALNSFPAIAYNIKQSPRPCNLSFSRPRAVPSHLKAGRLSPGQEAVPACKDKGHQFVAVRRKWHAIYHDSNVYYVYFCQTINLWKIFRFKWRYATKFSTRLFVVHRMLPNSWHETEVWIKSIGIL